ncbi:hypothetical protein [Polaribacter sargassicola]|uniref:hypothetical protein n=1 Tax=Polaribacter sargassicola TaxID=2836891 RepID=UPI001F18D9AE|nr:hypothetical protein [Polaribacter sp. DS7-9]MCG1035282.1 hypothetical protein [Polaribacter sp. DS7-9]
MEYLAKKPGLVIFLLTIIFVGILDFGFKIDNSIVRILIAAPMAAFLSPRKKIINTQSGDKTQITWFFLKKPLVLDK